MQAVRHTRSEGWERKRKTRKQPDGRQSAPVRQSARWRMPRMPPWRKKLHWKSCCQQKCWMQGAFGGLLRSSGFFRGSLFFCDELDDRGKFTVAGVGQELVPCVGALGCGFGRTGYVRRLGSDGHRAEHIEYGDSRDRDCNGNTHSDRSSDAGNQFFLHRITPVSEDRVEMTDDKDTIPEKGNQ